MAVFANIFEEPEACMGILDRLILQKEAALVNIIKHVYRNMKSELLKYMVQPGNREQSGTITDSGLLQAYLVRLVYIDAHQRGLLYPPIDHNG